jgi:hypothetical protein
MMEPFGRYVLLEKIAKGGMAEVFRAAAMGTSGFSKMVAIKRVLPHLAEEADFVTMLVDEANIASTLSHPNILQVLDLGQQHGQHFIAMEFVAGRSMDALFSAANRKGVMLPQEVTTFIVTQALHGLAFAHDKTDAFGKPAGIIHRDVSPQNIMVGFDGGVKLADFGIARAADRTTHTAAGTIKGKPGYMSPEQLNGGDVDQRLDIYAFGVVLHECFTQKRMRKPGPDAQVLANVMAGTYPRFEEVGVNVPPQLAAVVYRALAPVPVDRLQTARMFASALEAVSRDLGWHCTPSVVASWMAKLFPEELEAERQSQLHFAQLLRNPNADLAGLVDAAQGPAGQEQTKRSPGRAAQPDGTATATLQPTELMFTGSVTSPTAPDVDNQTRHGMVPPRNGPPWTLVAVLALGLVAAGVALLRPNPVVTAPVVQGNEPTAAASPAKAGPLTIQSNPPGAQVLIDGAPQAQPTPLTVLDLTPGQHVVLARRPGMVATQQTVVLTGGVGTSVTLVLTPEVSTAPLDRHGTNRKPGNRTSKPGAAEPEPAEELPGKLTLTSRPWGTVSVDGVDTGKFTPVMGLPLSAGKHTIRLHNSEENVEAVFTVDIQAGQELSVSRELK